MEEAEEKKGKRGHHPDNNRRAKVTEIGPDQEFENDEVIASIEHKVPLGDTQEHKAEHGGTQESKAVDHHGNDSQCGFKIDQGGKHVGLVKVSVTTETEVLSKEELRERARLAKEQEEKRQEEIKREMAMKTLKEYEEQKAIEKQKKAETASLSKSKNGTTKKDVNIDKDTKVYKTMSIAGFMKLPTESKGDEDGPCSVRSESSVENTNGGGTRIFSAQRGCNERENSKDVITLSNERENSKDVITLSTA
ncbi:hypothetical protein AgCh_037735 [Apium graveolens]